LRASLNAAALAPSPGFLRDLLLDIGEVRVVVVADRAHREAARAIAERPDHAQQPLPEAEQVARAHGCLALLYAVSKYGRKLRDLRKAEFLRLGGAARLSSPTGAPRPAGRRAGSGCRIRRCTPAPACARRLELELGQDAGEVEARAELRREEVHFQPERAQAASMPRWRVDSRP
jgi:hypothetical protein